MTETVKVDLSAYKPDLSYDILIGKDIFSQIAASIKSANLGSRCAIITDSNINKYSYIGRLCHALYLEKFDRQVFVFPAGEENKTVFTWNKLSEEIEEAGFGRDSIILAVGGGITGDIAGFVAATYDRGIPYFQIPTTVVGQVDSSVGGKVAVNTSKGKNKRGTFHHPKGVFIDIETLATLPDEEFPNGIAECVKHALVANKEYFEALEYPSVSFRINERDSSIYLELARINCEIKAGIVSQDPDEKGLRRILNYGHTLGHAVEKVSGYKIPHGNAVSIGMIVAGTISRDMGYLDNEELVKQRHMLGSFRLPVKIPNGMSINEIIKATLGDKKSSEGRPRYCLLEKNGKVLPFNGEYVTEVPDKIVRAALNETR